MVHPGNGRDHRVIAQPSSTPPPPPPPPPLGAGRAGGQPAGQFPGGYRHGHWHGGGRRHGLMRLRSILGVRRSRDDRLLGGIAGGISRQFGVDVTIVRIALVIAAFVVGFGLAGYMIAWLLIPLEGEEHNVAARAVEDRRGIALALAILSALVVVALVASALGVGWFGSFVGWPTFVGAAAFVLIWRNVPDEERVLMEQAAQPLLGLGFVSGRSRSAVLVRVFAGVMLIGFGVTTLALGHPHLSVLKPLGEVLLIIAGFVVVLGPWWLRIARDLVAERRARTIAEERADMAARVHDSVLQTLALIQRRADQPQEVRQLARAQERELRSWLVDGRGPGPMGLEDTLLAEGVQRIVRDVEAAHGVPVETVTVGDCALDDDLRELLAAGREAAVNAAKWSGAPVVSVFVEVEPGAVSMFVRDRGAGFELAEVSGDRRGISESINGRMTRHGGKAAIRSSPGQGTEVALSMPRPAGRRKAGEVRV